MQLGFELEYTDPVTQEVVPWAEASKQLLSEISGAKWKIVDVETTGLNPTSKEVSLSGADYRRGMDSRLRLRVVTCCYPVATKVPSAKASELKAVAFDLDKLSSRERKDVCEAAYSQVVFGWNVGFDAYWLLHSAPNARAKKLVDLMLLARALRPQHPVEMAILSGNEEADPELRSIALDMFTQGRSGWALRDVACNLLGLALDKSSQKPKNWCEPFLSQKAYDYAVGDTTHAHDIGRILLGAKEGEDLLEAYERCVKRNEVVQRLEPQVADIVCMRLNGTPWSVSRAEAYVRKQWAKVKELADKMIELEPALDKFRYDLGNAEAGVSAGLKEALGQIFTKRGLVLQTTQKTGTFQIGEKDLRKVQAEKVPGAKEFFDLWVGLNRAKKAGGMAREVSGFAQRSGDGRIHPNTGHGPVTGRLSSAEPNAQQFPRDQLFRDCVEALEGYDIVASDYSALDMRVGAALAIRAQQQIREVFEGKRRVESDVRAVIFEVYEARIDLKSAVEHEKASQTAMRAHRALIHEAEGSAKKAYWQTWRELSRQLLLSSFRRCLVDVLARAKADGTQEWGSLRNAFSIAGMDIHTWTALGMLGQDPLVLFGGKSDEEVAALLKAKKKELGDKRQTGKVGNLSLLYAMKAAGLQEAAAKNYNIHWTLEEAEKVRNDWLAAYVEIDLWHKWTELNPFTTVAVPDPDAGGDIKRKQVYASYTLGGRLIYAFGLNAALSYEDQSTGADILGRVMDRLHTEYPQVFDTVINQVHDEVVFMTPSEHTERYTQIIQQVMVECSEEFLMKFGVKGECSPAIGKVWVKD